VSPIACKICCFPACCFRLCNQRRRQADKLLSPAKQNYEKGLDELKAENYSEASRYFAYVKQKFPFSKYAAWPSWRGRH